MNTMMRAGAAIAVALTAAVSLSACGAAAKSNTGSATSGSSGGGSSANKTVVDLLPSYDNSWMAAYGNAFEAQGKSLGMTVKTQTNNFDVAAQSQQIDDAIAQKVALINILPTNETAELPALRRAKAAKIPVIITTSPLKPGNEDLYAAYYGPDHTKLGQLAADSVCKALTSNGRSGGDIALITGAQTFYESILRINAFNAQLKNCSAPINVVSTQDGQWATNVSEKEAAQLFATYQGPKALSAIYAMADNQADGVITAAKQAGISVGADKGNLTVVASNCTTEGVKNIGAGLQYSTNTQMAAVDGRANADLVSKYLSGAPIPKDNYDESTLVTKSNLSQYAKGCTT